MSQLHEVMLVALVIWVGLFAYLWRLDARIREIRRSLPGPGAGESVEAPEAVLEPGPGRTGDGQPETGAERSLAETAAGRKD